MNIKYKNLLAKLSLCGTIMEEMEILKAHEDLVDEEFINELIDDDILDEFLMIPILAVLYSKGIEIDSKRLPKF